MCNPKPFLVLFTVFLFLCVNLLAQRNSYTTERVPDNSIRIDADPSETVWESVEWSGNYIQTQPYDSAAPSQNTAFKTVYDDNAIYFLIRAFDTAPDSIERQMCRRDGWEGDFVEIYIDSYYDRNTAFGFNVNAAGVRGDAIITGDGNHEDETWDPVWFAKTAVDDKGWIAEIKIPYTQLRFGNKEVQVWGLQMGRRLYRHAEWSYWQYISPTASGFTSSFGDLQGIRDIQPKRQVEIMPFMLGGYEHYEKEEGNPFRQGSNWLYNAGIDGKIGISNNFILDFTVNPDFGQVEADPSEVNLTTYETYFRERRPFFIEGKNLLDFKVTEDDGPMSSNDVLFYSRRVGKSPSYRPELDDNEYADVPDNTTILAAFKVTGKTSDGWSVGIMNSITQKEVAIIDDEGIRRQETVEPMTNYLASRVMKDFNKANSQLGFSFNMVNRNLKPEDVHLTEYLGRNAFSAGLNFRHQWKDKTYFVDGTFVYSQVNGSSDAMTGIQTSRPKYFQRPDAGHLNVDSLTTHLGGTGGTFRIGKQGNAKWQYAFTLTHRSPALEINDAGFLGQGDIIRQLAWLTYEQTEPKSIFRSTYLMWIQTHGMTFGGERKFSQLMFFGNTRLMNYWGGGFSMAVGAPRKEVNELRGGPALYNPAAYDGHVFIGSDYRKRINGYLGTYLSKNFNREARYGGFFTGIQIRPINALVVDIELEYSKNIDRNQYVTNILDDFPEPRYIRSRFDQKEMSLQIRATFNITPDFTIQYYGMPFVSIGRYVDFSHVTDPKSRELENRVRYYTPEQISFDKSSDEYLVDETINGSTDYRFSNPDFNVKDFNSNFVLRWEYRAGSVLYLVWTQNRFEWSSNGAFRMDNSVRDLLKLHPHNVFMIKLSYRFGV
jgi:hypothetical protein